jgi:plasmid maintenance system antidote protein VapI
LYFLPVAVAEACNLDPRTTYQVKIYIYGLPDSGRAYYLAYRDHLIDSGYIMTASDPCLFVRLLKNYQTRTYFWIHVDDTIAASTHEGELDHLKESLKQKFKITTNDFTKHLGINIKKLESGAIKL